MTIELRQLRFFAYHGLFPGENRVGTDFEVDLSASYDNPKSTINKLTDTINYVRLYEIVKKRMAVPTNLLETIAMEIAETIKQEFSAVNNIEISIYKLNPPIEDFQGQVGIRFKKDF